MDEAPIPVKNPEQKIFELTSNKEINLFLHLKKILNQLRCLFLLFLMMGLSKYFMRVNFL